MIAEKIFRDAKQLSLSMSGMMLFRDISCKIPIFQTLGGWGGVPRSVNCLIYILLIWTACSQLFYILALVAIQFPSVLNTSATTFETRGGGSRSVNCYIFVHLVCPAFFYYMFPSIFTSFLHRFLCHFLWFPAFSYLFNINIHPRVLPVSFIFRAFLHHFLSLLSHFPAL